jgi:hypothetical protein
MSIIIKGYDQEFIVDVYVYAATKDVFGIGAYDIVINGQSYESQVVKFPKGTSDLSCYYMETLQRAFMKAADIVGKYAIPVLDPQKNLLVKKNEKSHAQSRRLGAKFLFKFHIPNARAFEIAKGSSSSVLTEPEQKWNNLFRLMKMGMARPNLPYRNLRIFVEYEFRKSDEAEVSEIAEYSQKELNHVYTTYHTKHEQRQQEK